MIPLSNDELECLVHVGYPLPIEATPSQRKWSGPGATVLYFIRVTVVVSWQIRPDHNLLRDGGVCCVEELSDLVCPLVHSKSEQVKDASVSCRNACEELEGPVASRRDDERPVVEWCRRVENLHVFGR